MEFVSEAEKQTLFRKSLFFCRGNKLQAYLLVSGAASLHVSGAWLGPFLGGLVEVWHAYGP